jgi:transcriptional regulator with XRE-family HTH domain
MVNFDRLIEERKRMGLNQADFGAIGGVTKQSQHMYEVGKRFPDVAYLAAIAAEGADVLYIVTGRRTPNTLQTLSAEENALLASFSAAPQLGQVAAMAALEATTQATQPQQVFHGNVGNVIGTNTASINQTFGNTPRKK